MQELTALSARVGRLEQDNAQLKTENASLQAENDRLEATSEYLKDNATATRKQLAQDGPKVAEAERITKAAEWASRISWKADARYRHEFVDPEEALDDQTRHRIRARLAMTAKINDTLTGTIGLATNGGTNDPRSTNQTLGEGWTRKGIALDLAYVDWKPTSSLGMTFGKMPQPWYKVSGYFFDNDINPEGISARYTGGLFFANAFGMWLSERSTASDATLFGGQLGLAGEIGPMKLTGALGYFDVGTVEGEITTTNTTLGCTANTAFFGGAQGNTTNTNGAGCAFLANDFNMIEALAQAEFTIAEQPLQIWAQFIQNNEADDLDTGWLAGFNWGKASNPQHVRVRLRLWRHREGRAVWPVRRLRLRRRRDRRGWQHLQDRLRAGQELGSERHVLHEQPVCRRPGRDRAELRPLPDRHELEVLISGAVTKLS